MSKAGRTFCGQMSAFCPSASDKPICKGIDFSLSFLSLDNFLRSPSVEEYIEEVLAKGYGDLEMTVTKAMLKEWQDELRSQSA